MGKKIYLVTGNVKKFEVAKYSLEKYDIDVEQLDIETPEIQSTSTEEVAKYSVKFATNMAGKPVLKGDVGFCIEALNGFPGPFVKYVNNWLTADKLVSMYINESNRKAKFIDALGYCEPGKEPVCFVTNSYGTLTDSPRGDNGVMVDSLFIPDGYDKTLAELTHDEMLKYWDNDRYAQLAELLNKE